MLMTLGATHTAASAQTDYMTLDDETHTIITIVCTVYGQIMGMPDMDDCTVSFEYVFDDMHAGPMVEVSVPEGALYPACSDSDSCFDPYSTTVDVGTQIVWTNDDIVLHTVTASEPHPDGNFDGLIQPGEEFSFTFETPGTYTYGCLVHPWASGVVVVGSDEDLAIAASGKLVERYMAGENVFGALEPHPNDELYWFVINATNRTIIGHQNPQFLGFPVEPLLSKAFISTDLMLEILAEEEEGAWLSYPLPDLQGNIIAYERGWFQLYDGYVFAARYTVEPEERVMNVVDEMIHLYNSDPENAFDRITAFMSTNPNYPFVLDPNTGTVVAHGSNPDRIGATSVVFTNSSVPPETFLNMEEGEGIWSEYVFANPETGEEESKISWIILHDGYLFGSGYYP